MMKNPFRRFKGKRDKEQEPVVTEETAVQSIPEPDTEPGIEDTSAKAGEEPEKEPADGFTEWCRSQTRGGIERRERNDIYEAYNVYGADKDGALTCRVYHKYPEHERDFGLTYSRALSFDDFDRRLLAELDRGDIKLADYDLCIKKAQSLSQSGDEAQTEAASADFSDKEIAAIKDFCESIDILRDKSYLHSEGQLSCDCVSAVGDDRLCVRFRKPLRFDAAGMTSAGVSRSPAAGYDIENLWIMGVYNRISQNSESCRAELLTSEWSVEKESLYLISVEGFAGVEGRLLTAVGEADSFRRFGFFSLDFSNK